MPEAIVSMQDCTHFPSHVGMEEVQLTLLRDDLTGLIHIEICMAFHKDVTGGDMLTRLMNIRSAQNVVKFLLMKSKKNKK